MPLLAQIAAIGVRLEALPDGNLRAFGHLTDATRALIRMHKPELLAELTAANDASGRYWHAYFHDAQPPMEVIFSDD